MRKPFLYLQSLTLFSFNFRMNQENYSSNIEANPSATGPANKLPLINHRRGKTIKQGINKMT